MLLGVGLIGSAQVSARHWLERDSKLTREQAQTLATNIIWRGISGFPRNEH
jgi:Tfp pilus assembly protein PilV